MKRTENNRHFSVLSGNAQSERKTQFWNQTPLMKTESENKDARASSHIWNDFTRILNV